MLIDAVIQEVNTVWYSYEFYVNQFVFVSFQFTLVQYHRSIIGRCWCFIFHFFHHHAYEIPYMHCSPRSLWYDIHLFIIRVCSTTTRLHINGHIYMVLWLEEILRIHTCAYTHIRYVHVHTHTYIHIHTYCTYVFTRMHIYCIHSFTHMYIYTYTLSPIHTVHTYIHTYLHTYIHPYIQT